MNPWHILGWFMIVIGTGIVALVVTAMVMAIRITNDEIRKEKGLDK